jgi:hypothetical protein
MKANDILLRIKLHHASEDDARDVNYVVEDFEMGNLFRWEILEGATSVVFFKFAPWELHNTIGPLEGSGLIFRSGKSRPVQPKDKSLWTSIDSFKLEEKGRQFLERLTNSTRLDDAMAVVFRPDAIIIFLRHDQSEEIVGVAVPGHGASAHELIGLPESLDVDFPGVFSFSDHAEADYR